MRPRIVPLVVILLAGLAPAGEAIAGVGRCDGARATISGTSGRDRIRGTGRRDVISAGRSADTISGRGGRDLICGGPGRDRIRGGPGGDRLRGQGGADTIDGDGGPDAIHGGGGADRCFQGTGRGPTKGCVPVVAAAGDIACATDDESFNGTHGTARYCRMRATSNLLLRTNLAGVLPLGDNQYGQATVAEYQASYDPTWGRVKDISRPVAGNHEYDQPGAQGYFDYFGVAAGPPSRGYYSFDVGRWHLVALNTNTDCSTISCAAGSEQHTWLVEDLAASGAPCTLALWHEPRFTSSGANDPKVGPFWEALFAAGAEVVLNGHAHVYERFAPQTPAGAHSPTGIRQFTVGTGGKKLHGFGAPKPTSQVRSNSSFGVLELALAPNGYDWRFVAAAGEPPFIDRGSGRCH